MDLDTTTFEKLFADLPRRTTTETGDAFELLSDWALLASHEYGPLIATIERYEEYARREDLDVITDTGIDRIITTHSGEIWAVQNKGYGNRSEKVPFGEFNNFLVRGMAIGASRLLLVTSGGGITAHSEENNRAMQSRVAVLSRVWLEEIDTYPTTWEALREAVLKIDPTNISRGGRYELRNDQHEAVDSIAEKLRTNREVQYVAACGTGKTVTSQAIGARLQARTTVVFVPSLSLMTQTIKSWYRQSEPTGMHAIAVCSDEAVAKDVIRVSDQELRCKVIRTPGAIADFVSGRTAIDDGLPIAVFSTYHSAGLVVRAQHEHGMQEFDYMFADEAHHLVATALDGGLLGDVVKRKNDGKLRVEAKHRVYATATPRQMSKAVIAQAKKHGSKPLDSMGVDSDAFGPEAYRLTFGEAIDLGILTDYQLSIIAVPEDDHAKFINQRAYVDFDHVDGVIDGQTFATVQAIKELYEGGYRRIVTYHTYVKDAIRFAKIIEGMEGLPGSAAVYGSLSATERTRRLDRLKSDEGYVISNVRCLNEGVDIPALDAIVFADPKSSEVDIAQSVGRVLRRAPGKKIGLVVIPVALSSDQWESGEIDQERLESDLDATGPFKTVIDVMLALGDHDDTIRQIIHDMRFGLGKRHNQKGMQADVDADFDDESDLDDVNAFIDGVVGDDGKVDRTMKAPFPNDTSSIFGNGKVTLHAPGMTAEMLERFAQNMRNAVVRRATKTRNTEEDAIINMLIENWEVTTRKAVKLSRRIFHLLASGMPAQEAAMSVSRGLVTKRKAA